MRKATVTVLICAVCLWCLIPPAVAGGLSVSGVGAKAKGMGGVTVKDTLAMPRDEHTGHIRDIPFMSPEWLDMFGHIVAECERLGLICRCRLGSGWNAGGPWVTPAMSSQVLTFERSAPIEGPTTFRSSIPIVNDGQPALKALQSDEAFVLAVSTDGKTLDLTSQVDDRRAFALGEISQFGNRAGFGLVGNLLPRADAVF